MKTLLTLVFVLTLTAGAAYSQQSACFGWEDGASTALGCYNCDNTDYFNDDAFVSEGSRSFAATDLGGSTPQIYIAWVTGLVEGDEITATMDAYDDTAGENPALRLWGHYTLESSIEDYDGSTGMGSDYSGASGAWDVLTATWVIPADKVALCIELRPYDSDPYGRYNWADNLCVTIPDHATLHFPDGTVGIDDEAGTWGGVKALYR